MGETGSAWCPVAGFCVSCAELSGSAACEVAQEIVIVTKKDDVLVQATAFTAQFDSSKAPNPLMF